MSLYKIVRSKTYKNFMAKLYGIGASLVISGALFKILHMPGADWMLMIGMGTEALIFFCSAFEPLHKEYDWTSVYPELQLVDGANGKGKGDSSSNKSGNITQQLDKMLYEAKIGPELLESLSSGMRNLSENARKLSTVSDAASVTEGYVANLSKAKDAAQNLAGVYEKSADIIVSTSDLQAKSTQEIIEKQKEHAQKLQSTLTNTTDLQVKGAQELFDVQKQHAQKLQNALTSTAEMQVKGIQELFEMQKIHAQQLQETQKQSAQKIENIHEQNTQAILENFRKIQDTSAALANSMSESAQDVQKYKSEIDLLSKNVAQINYIYANMLAAMTNK